MALYRKYRPASFGEVVGQQQVTVPLSRALDSGRINHAYLFSGPRGCGKTSSARILARSLNCVEGPTSTPCGVCPSCISLAPGGPGNLDVTELDAASHNGVEDMRELRDRALYAPAESRYRVFIVDEAHMITNAGSNALLKIVEEPPAHLVFIFATTEPEKVIGTIRSRTHHYPFRLLTPTDMRMLLERTVTAEDVTVDDAVYPLVIRAGGGSPRDSLSILDQLLAGAGGNHISYEEALPLLGVTDTEIIDSAVNALAAGDAGALYQTIERVIAAGHEPRRFTIDLLHRLRDLMVLQAVPQAIELGLVDVPVQHVPEIQKEAQSFSEGRLAMLAQVTNDGLELMRGATAPRLLLEILGAKLLMGALPQSAITSAIGGPAQIPAPASSVPPAAGVPAGNAAGASMGAPGVGGSAGGGHGAPAGAAAGAPVGAPSGGEMSGRAAALAAARAAASRGAGTAAAGQGQRDMNPVTQGTAPTERDMNPVTQGSAPTERDMNPVTQGSAPTERDTKHVTQESGVVERDTKHVTQGSAPVERDTKHVTATVGSGPLTREVLEAQWNAVIAAVEAPEIGNSRVAGVLLRGVRIDSVADNKVVLLHNTGALAARLNQPEHNNALVAAIKAQLGAEVTVEVMIGTRRAPVAVSSDVPVTQQAESRPEPVDVEVAEVAEVDEEPRTQVADEAVMPEPVVEPVATPVVEAAEMQPVEVAPETDHAEVAEVVVDEGVVKQTESPNADGWGAPAPIGTDVAAVKWEDPAPIGTDAAAVKWDDAPVVEAVEAEDSAEAAVQVFEPAPAAEQVPPQSVPDLPPPPVFSAPVSDVPVPEDSWGDGVPLPEEPEDFEAPEDPGAEGSGSAGWDEPAPEWQPAAHRDWKSRAAAAAAVSAGESSQGAAGEPSAEEEEEEMIRSARTETGQRDTRDAREIAMDLLAQELGARQV